MEELLTELSLKYAAYYSLNIGSCKLKDVTVCSIYVMVMMCMYVYGDKMNIIQCSVFFMHHSSNN